MACTKEDVTKSISDRIYAESPIIFDSPFPQCMFQLYKTIISISPPDDIVLYWQDYFESYQVVIKKDYLTTVKNLKTSPLYFQAARYDDSPLCGTRYPFLVKLTSDPGISFPTNIRIQWENGYLIFWGEMTSGEKTKLEALSSDTTYKKAIGDLYTATQNCIKRVFIGDLLWLFYFEQMGLFKILGKILDDFAIKGKWPIENNDKIAHALEFLVLFTKMGLSSTVRDRVSSYRRCLGWTTELGRKLKIVSEINREFTNYFHKFIQVSLEYYKDKRLAEAIKGTQLKGKPSVATLTTIRNTIELLKNAFKKFDYGRNHTITSLGILWVIITMGLCREMKEVFGAPLVEPYQYLAKIYNALGLGSEEEVKYTERKQCAITGREILLDLQFLEFEDPKKLEAYLEKAEPIIEGYRTNVIASTGVDIGASGTLKIPQNA